MKHRVSKSIKYTKGYKYLLCEKAVFKTGILIDRSFVAPKATHTTDGYLIIHHDFGWDGCSGPAIDDDTNMRACLAHDALYYLFRHGFPNEYREQADELLKRLMIEDKASSWRAGLYRWFASKFGKNNASPKNKRRLLISPKRQKKGF